eukprot:scpid92029/ scgid18516/ 
MSGAKTTSILKGSWALGDTVVQVPPTCTQEPDEVVAWLGNEALMYEKTERSVACERKKLSETFQNNLSLGCTASNSGSTFQSLQVWVWPYLKTLVSLRTIRLWRLMAMQL